MQSYNSTENIAARLRTIGNNIQGSSSLKKVCIEAADRLMGLHEVVGDIIQDEKRIDHECADPYCPVKRGEEYYYMGL